MTLPKLRPTTNPVSGRCGIIIIRQKGHYKYILNKHSFIHINHAKHESNLFINPFVTLDLV